MKRVELRYGYSEAIIVVFSLVMLVIVAVGVVIRAHSEGLLSMFIVDVYSFYERTKAHLDNKRSSSNG